MTFKEWFNSAPHRAKYTDDHSAYLAAREAWDAAHEACAKVCDEIYFQKYPDAEEWERSEEGEAIRARGQA